jgi:hypothetical protein
VAAFHLLAETEGILPALESAHAIAEVIRRAPGLSQKNTVLVNLSGRGDKDVESVIEFDEAAAQKVRDEEELESFEARRKALAAIPRAEPRERPHGAPGLVPEAYRGGESGPGEPPEIETPETGEEKEEIE